MPCIPREWFSCRYIRRAKGRLLIVRQAEEDGTWDWWIESDAMDGKVLTGARKEVWTAGEAIAACERAAKRRGLL